MSINTDPDFREAEHRLIAGWNSTQADYPDVCVHELFERQAEAHPDAIALVQGDRQLMYRELNGRANQVARHLRMLGVKAESLVGVCVERSLEMVVAMLGILKAGGAYVPIDPADPTSRLEHIISEAGLDVVLKSPNTTLPPDSPISHAVEVKPDGGTFARESDQPSDAQVRPDNLAYVIYTSGSTGKPKGVAMAHRSLTNLLWWHARTRSASCGLKTLQFCAVSFDFSFHEIFSTLCLAGRWCWWTKRCGATRSR